MSYPKEHKIKRPFPYTSADETKKPGYLEQKWDGNKPGWRNPQQPEEQFIQHKIRRIGEKR